MGDFKEPLCPICCNNSEIRGDAERMEKIIDRAGGRPIFKGSGFYETDYKYSKNLKTKSVYNIERKKDKTIENMHKEASKAFPEPQSIKPIPTTRITNMSREKRLLDNVDPDMGPIKKRKSGNLDKL